MMQRNAIILAAGTSSRFVPLSQECPKGLLEVKGEVLIERQIRQLQEAGVSDICIVVGYKAEMFSYLKDRYGVDLVYNEDYARYNNASSMIRVLDRLGNTFICSSDNYFRSNVFADELTESYYSALYASGNTAEYCLDADEDGRIRNVRVGGADSWYMAGHVFFSKVFSDSFKRLLSEEYDREETRLGYWEDVYVRNIDTLPAMRINRYSDGEIAEFDTLDELREFDPSYLDDTRSHAVKDIAGMLSCKESELSGFANLSGSGDAIRFSFRKDGVGYIYDSKDKSITKTGK